MPFVLYCFDNIRAQQKRFEHCCCTKCRSRYRKDWTAETLKLAQAAGRDIGAVCMAPNRECIIKAKALDASPYEKRNRRRRHLEVMQKIMRHRRHDVTDREICDVMMTSYNVTSHDDDIT